MNSLLALLLLPRQVLVCCVFIFPLSQDNFPFPLWFPLWPIGVLVESCLVSSYLFFFSSFVWLISSFIPLWSEKMFNIFYSLNFCWGLFCDGPVCGLFWRIFHAYFKRMCILLLWMCCPVDTIESNWSIESFSTSVALLIFFLMICWHIDVSGC